MSAPTTNRPFSVSLVGYLGVFGGLLSCLVGTLVLIANNDDDLQDKSGLTSAELVGTGVGMILSGMVLVGLAVWFLGGSYFVRLLFGLFSVLHLAGGIHAVIAFHGDQRLAGAISAGVGFVIVWILFFDEDAKRWYASTE